MLDERLHTVLSHVEGPVLLDIGSDHAYLPIQALKENIITHAICGEIVEGPFLSSKKNVKLHGYESVIDVRLGDGLAVVKPDDSLNTISICGMGGPLIASILDNGLSTIPQRPRLVLQANTYTYPIRNVLQKYNYKIVDEVVIQDKHHFYEIIVADLSDELVEYSDLELTFGPILLKRRDETFIGMLTRELEHQTRILESMKRGSSTDKIDTLDKKINTLKGVLANESS